MSHISAHRASNKSPRAHHLQQSAANLPFAVHDKQHGWGIVARPVKRRHSGTPDWYFVLYARGIECRTLIPGEGFNRFFSWDRIGDDVRDHLAFRAGLSPRRKTWWGVVRRAWG